MFSKKLVSEIKKEGMKSKSLNGIALAKEGVSYSHELIGEIDKFHLENEAKGKEVWAYEAGSNFVNSWMDKKYPRWQKKNRKFEDDLFNLFINEERDFMDFNEDSSCVSNCYYFAI